MFLRIFFSFFCQNFAHFKAYFHGSLYTVHVVMVGHYEVVERLVIVGIAAGLGYYLFRKENVKDEVFTIPSEGGLGLSDDEKRKIFIPTNHWQTVEDNHICPAGLEYKLNLTDGTKLARFIPS